MTEFYRDRGLRWAEEGNLCHFGIGAALGTALAGALGGGAIATTIGSIAGPALVGAAGGAALSGITGGNPLTGALTGGLTGGVLGGVGDIASSAGLGAGATTALETAAGAGAGALGGAITGGSPLSGALTGGVTGLASGVLSSPSAPAMASTPATGAAGGVSAGSLAGPDIAGQGGGAATDLATAASLNAAPTSNAIGASVGPQITTPLAGGSITGSANPIPSISSTTGTSMTPLDLASTLNAAPTMGAPVGPQTVAPVALDAAGQPVASSGFGSMLDNAVSSLTKNPLALLGAGGLALDYLMTPNVSQLPETKPLEQSAGNLAAQGNNLMSYMQTGTLPPGAQEAVNSATQAAKAQVRSNYANLGLSGSTMEGEALNMVDQNAAAQTFSIANQLMSEGANFTNLSDQMYQNILNLTLQQDTAFQNALSSFSGGLAGMGLVGAMKGAA